MNSNHLLAVVERDEFIEAEHFGAAVTLDPAGDIVEEYGDVRTPFLARSALKPIFAATLLAENLVSLEPRFLALASASHAGHRIHIDTASTMASSLGVREGVLRCPPMREEGGGERRFAHMCSGKHIAMSAAARAMGEPGAYWGDTHPLAAVLRAGVAAATGEEPAGVAHDGCGALVFATSAIGLARAFARLAPGGTGALASVGDAMRQNPVLIDGDGKPDAVVIAATGCATKFGAEGTQAIVAPDGTTAVVKVADGARRAGAPIALTLLERAGAVPAGTLERLADALHVVQRSAEVPVGALRVVL